MRALTSFYDQRFLKDLHLVISKRSCDFGNVELNHFQQAQNKYLIYFQRLQQSHNLQIAQKTTM